MQPVEWGDVGCEGSRGVGRAIGPAEPEGDGAVVAPHDVGEGEAVDHPLPQGGRYQEVVPTVRWRMGRGEWPQCLSSGGTPPPPPPGGGWSSPPPAEETKHSPWLDQN